MRVFIGMEESQTIQQAFEHLGHDAWSCDLKPGRVNSSKHLQGDVFNMIDRQSWELVILHPVCRFLSSSGQHRNGKPGQRTHAEVEEAVEDFMRCVQVAEKFPRWAIENPIGIMSTRYRKPNQIVQPHQFGDDASKSTCLWTNGLPLLVPTLHIAPRIVNGKRRWANQTDSGQNRLAPTKDPEDRRAARAVTYLGIAKAMATQWGAL